jgi:hypothetical protein
MSAACEACNRSKASKFPVLEERAPPEAQGLALDAEGALLLDPTNPHDSPEQHFGSFQRAKSAENLVLVRLMDEQFLETPWYGSRQMARYL